MLLMHQEKTKREARALRTPRGPSGAENIVFAQLRGAPFARRARDVSMGAPPRPARRCVPGAAAVASAAARDGATPSLPKSSVGSRKRVVIAGGGFCGAMVAYRLDKNPEFHVTLLDTKEYVENTPVVLVRGYHPKEPMEDGLKGVGPLIRAKEFDLFR